MHRFCVEPLGGQGAPGAVARFSREESVHACRVLRLRAGDEVELLDGEYLYSAQLTFVGDGGDRGLTTAQVLALRPSPESAARITLWQGLPKADKLESIVQKATELGVHALWPVEMERSVAKADKGGKREKTGQGHKTGEAGGEDGGKPSPKHQRLERIALEAAKQSGRAHVPQVEEACGFGQACGRLAAAQREGPERNADQPPPFDLVLVAWEEAEGLRLSQAIQNAIVQGRRPTSILIVIGPEGGITPAECQQLQALGALPVTLGRRILRTETAGPCALAVALAALDEM